MASAPKANAVVGQSGGPTGVINASLVGVVEAAKNHPEIQTIYGAIHAVAGWSRQFIDLGKLARTLETVAASPSSALGTSRDKPDAAYCRRILESSEAQHPVLFTSAATIPPYGLHYRHRGPEANYDMRAFHVPRRSITTCS
jgi:6-phosphofructokinase 1